MQIGSNKHLRLEGLITPLRLLDGNFVCLHINEHGWQAARFCRRQKMDICKEFREKVHSQMFESSRVHCDAL